MQRNRKENPPAPFQSISWRRLFAYLRPYTGRMAVAVLALLLSSGLGLAFPLVIVRLLESVTQSQSYGPLNTLAAALVGLFLLQALFTFAQSYLLTYIGEHIVYDLRVALYTHLQRLSLDFFAARRVGELVSRLSSDVTQMRTMLTTNITSLLSQIITLVGAVVIILSLNTSLTLLIAGLVPVLLLVAFTFGRRLQGMSVRVQDDLASSTVMAEEGLQGVRIVKSFGRENYETSRYKAAMQRTFRSSLSVALFNSIFMAVMMFLGFGAIAALVWYGGREVIADRLSLAMITGFLIYGVTIAMTLGGLGGLYAQLRMAVGGIQRVFELLDTGPTVQDASAAAALPPAEGRISFEDVWFSYEDGAPVLQGVSLELRAGEIVALVGPSGAGKSTLLNLIPRFYDPAGGRVRIDGRDLRGVTQASLRAQMAIVPQDTMLFGGSIRENILYGRLDASEAEVQAAARAANAHDFIMALPQGYDTLVGERGTKLSGGQRQRVAIARAILKDPRILLLDEATSALDNQSEGLVQEALNRLMQGRTTLIIAHRLSTIKVAHRIAVMDEGRIVELGTHDELMQQNGLYARLYAMQFKETLQAEAVL
ncbi:ABC transporter ATP-binding protein [Kouleothrix aurantiaca]|uniref:ABC transporter ATP-binding protein n=1 Tax=Kouleothrix aurantiaca TaxID=186479 RepID=A0A0P9DDQ9_9CHLR|nr:ABC transporter ATP-binding protein [Kouleothrix aurantiaca]